MKTMIKYIQAVTTLLVLISVPLQAQEKLTLKESIATVLNNNYSIRIAKNELELAANNYTLGSAGFLPKVDLSAYLSKTTNNTKKDYTSGLASDDISSNYSTSYMYAAFTWTLFDGLKMFTNYSKLREYTELGEMKVRSALETSVSDIIKAYYDIVKQSYLVKAAKEAVQISQERLKLTEDKMEVGSASKFDVLRARVDLNADRSTMLNYESEMMNLKINLNSLMARNVSIEFIVVDSFEVNRSYSYDELKESAFKKNVDLIQAEKNKTISGLDVNLSKGDFLPKINLNSNFYLSNTGYYSASTKSSLFNQFDFGLYLSWNLFNGFNTARDYQNAVINLDKSELRISAAKLAVESALLVAYRNYNKNLEILKLEEENVSVSKENLELAMEQLRLGTLSAVDFRDVQKNYLNAQSRLYTAYYSVKISERDLLKQSGIILQQ